MTRGLGKLNVVNLYDDGRMLSPTVRKCANAPRFCEMPEEVRTWNSAERRTEAAGHAGIPMQ
jgi:hypothetical protein